MVDVEKLMVAAQEESRAERELAWSRMRRTHAVAPTVLSGLMAMAAFCYVVGPFLWPSMFKPETVNVAAQGVVGNMRTEQLCGKGSRCKVDAYFLIGKTDANQCYIAYWPSGLPFPHCPSFLYALEVQDCSPLNVDKWVCEQLIRDSKQPNASLRATGIIFQIRQGHPDDRNAVDGEPVPR